MVRRLLFALVLLSASSSCRFRYERLPDAELPLAAVGGGAGGSGESAGEAAAGGSTWLSRGGSAAGTSAAGQSGCLSPAAPVFEVSFPDFAGAKGLHLVGASQLLGGALQLVDAKKDVKGAFYLEQPLTWAADSSLSVEFSLRIVAIAGEPPADGMTFILHNDPRMLDALADTGGSLGYAGPDGIRPSIGVKYDVFPLGPNDASTEHLAALADGKPTPLAVQASLPFSLATGDIRFSWIDYSQASQLLEVYLSDSPDKPTQPVLVHSISLMDTVGSRVFLGFSASTGGNVAEHLIQRLSVRQYAGVR